MAIGTFQHVMSERVGQENIAEAFCTIQVL